MTDQTKSQNQPQNESKPESEATAKNALIPTLPSRAATAWRAGWHQMRETHRRFNAQVAPHLLGEDPDADANPYAGYLSRSVLLEEAAPPRNARAVTTLVLGALLLFIALASISQLDERAVAEGEVLPVNYVQPMQHLEGGIVAAIHVQDGDEVEKGQVLINFDKTAPLAELETLKARHAALGLQVERLEAFALGREPDFNATAPGYDDLIGDQRSIYLAQLDSRNAQTSVIRSQISELLEEEAGLTQQVEALEREVSFAKEEVAMRAELLEKGLSSKVVFLNAQRQLARAEGQLAEIATQRSRNRAETAEARQRLLELEERLRTEALTEMGLAASEREQVGEQLARLHDRVERTAVRAPISGIVKGLIVTSPHTVIPPGQTILEIVPSDRNLIAEVRISPSDIGHVDVGSEAVVKINTFNYARYGGISGNVKQVSATTFRDEEGKPYFRGLVTLDQDFVGYDPLANRITPGMTLVANIKTGQKSLIGYLLRPIRNTIDDSFGER